mmetsp:Transcript_78439/g.138608  ORF Transcript_78439/g.138608 Transcript_78439/m.138608 type:complete len:109 (+) Transcript_78439:1047-1373(+)
MTNMEVGKTKIAATTKNKKSGGHKAFWLLFLIILAGSVYAGGGSFMNYKEGARGIEMLPHHEFWVGLPALCMDGFVFLAAAIMAAKEQAQTKLGPEPYERLPEDENPW